MSKPLLDNEIRRLASDAAAAAGVEVVEFVVRRAGSRSIVRVDIDRAGPAGVGLDDCRRMSERLSVLLDAHDDLLPASYVLEVSSPGVDRPIRTADDVRRNTGRRVVVDTKEPVAGRRTLHGVLLGGDATALWLDVEHEGRVTVPVATVALARQEVEI